MFLFSYEVIIAIDVTEIIKVINFMSSRKKLLALKWIAFLQEAGIATFPFITM